MRPALKALTAAVCALLLAACGRVPPDPEYADARSAILGEREIIHAAGAAADPETGELFIHSNSLEGLIQNYDAGARVFEIDFNFTSDGRLVCVHEWSTRFFPDRPDGVALTEKEFFEYKIFGRFTHMSLDTVAELMKDRPDLFVVTDIKDRSVEGAAVIAREYPELRDRFIIQIYNGSEYLPVRDLGFDNVIFTLYKLSYAEKTDVPALVEFARSHPLTAFAFGEPLCRIDGYVEGMREAGVLLLVHTINGTALREKYAAMGADAVYTDYGSYIPDAPEGIF